MSATHVVDCDRAALQYEYVCLVADYQDIDRTGSDSVDVEKVFRIVTRMQEIERLLRDTRGLGLAIPD